MYSTLIWNFRETSAAGNLKARISTARWSSLYKLHQDLVFHASPFLKSSYLPRAEVFLAVQEKNFVAFMAHLKFYAHCKPIPCNDYRDFPV